MNRKSHSRDCRELDCAGKCYGCVGIGQVGTSSGRKQSGGPMSKITPCLWYAGDGEEAARLYTSLLPDSRIDNVVRSPTDYPGGKAGDALVIEFTLAGQGYMALNGGQKVEY